MCLKYSDINQDEQESLDEKLIELFRAYVKLIYLDILDDIKDIPRGEIKTNFTDTITARLNEIDDKFLFEELEGGKNE